MRRRYWIGATFLIVGVSFSFAQYPPWRSPIVSTQKIAVSGSLLQVDFAPGELDLTHEDIIAWITRAANCVATYYGRFPVTRERILIVPVANSEGVMQGTSWGNHGVFTRMRLGQHTTRQDLESDWVMTHEFVHTAFPMMADEHEWIEEGLATYVEPIARAQAAILTPEKVWTDMVRDMPQGEPRKQDHGLDRTHTWASTYWGGALFFLLADIGIRERTGNRMGLQDALRAIIASGKTIEVDSNPKEAFAIGDKATGTSVLTEMYANVRDKPVEKNLSELWSRLGVRAASNGTVSFDNSAALAPERKSIMQRKP